MTSVKGPILLTGASGFLGAHLLPALLACGYKVIILKRSHSDTSRISAYLKRITVYDIDGKAMIEKIFSRHRFSGVIHLATDYGKRNNNDIKQMGEANLQFATELVDWAAKTNAGYFINTHTYAHSGYTLYSAMKNAFVEILKYYSGNFPLKIINMRLEYVYGPKDDTTKLIPLIVENFLHGKRMKNSPGLQKRDFIFVDDVVLAYLKVLNCLPRLPEGLTQFEIGTGKSQSLKSFVRLIEKFMGVSDTIDWGAVSYRVNEIFDSKADTSLAWRKLGWKPLWDQREALNKTITWHKEQSR